MTQILRRGIPTLLVLAFVASAIPAFGQISKTNVYFPRKTAGTNAVAFDTTNQVYLVVMIDSPGFARFVSKDGVLLGSEFRFTTESSFYYGWYSVVFGGPPSDPVFIVSYIAMEGTNGPYTKCVRLIRYQAGGGASIGPRIAVTDTGGVWFAGEKSLPAWDGQQFVVPTLIPAAGGLLQPILHHVSTAGAVSGGQTLSDYMDNYGNGAVACSIADRLCVISGWAQGTPFGGYGGSYFRLFNADTLQPVSARMSYADDHLSRNEDQAVIYNVYTGQFLMAWQGSHTDAQSYVDHRLVNKDGSMGVLDLTKSIGPGAGDNRMAFNPSTRTTLIVGKYAPPGTTYHADFYAAELDDTGAMKNRDQVLLLVPWDNTSPIYAAAVAADPVNSRWFVEMWFGPGVGYLVQGTAGVYFGKVSPASGTADLTSSVNLSWQPVAGVTSYEYCVSTTSGSCSGAWASAGTTPATTVSGLSIGTYYWQVRATANGQTAEADAGAWWRMNVGAMPFNKSAPANGAVVSGTSTTLSWLSMPGATAYYVCLDTTNNGWCDSGWVAMGTATSAAVTGLSPGTYFWQVQATTTRQTNADGGTWWSFVVLAPAGSLTIDWNPSNVPNGSWIFSEGAKGLAQGFNTYYLFANENSGPAHVRGWVVKEDGSSTTSYVEFTIPAFTRRTVDLSSIVGATTTGSYSAVFQSIPYVPDGIPAGRQVYVARSMYWGSTGGILTGPGHEKMGTYLAPGAFLPTQWYFAEGTRVGQFVTNYSVFNPGSAPAAVYVEFFSDNGTGVIKTVSQTVPAQSRWTLSTSALAELASRNFSARISSTNGVGIVAERSMYWGANWTGGHTGGGGTATARDWYFAEGAAQNGFETFYTLMNPTAAVVSTDVTYQLSPLANGTPQAPVVKSYTLQPYSRTTIYLYSEVGYQPGVASEFHASDAIVAERSEYWGTPWSEASTTVGAYTPAVEWHLVEGSTLNGFDTFLCLSNPNSSDAQADVTTYSDAGVAETHSVTVAAKSRLTLYMGNQTATANHPVFTNISANSFSMKVVSTGTTPLPIVAEEAVYWTPIAGVGQYRRGGDAAMGFPVIR